MYRWPQNLPSTRPGDPMPPLLAVREFLGKHGDLGYFDAEVQDALVDAEQTNNFRELREAIAAGLWSAICAEHITDVRGMNAEARGAFLLEQMHEWLFTHRPVTLKQHSQARAAQQEAWRAARPAPPRDPQAKPCTWEFAGEAPPGFPQDSDGQPENDPPAAG